MSHLTKREENKLDKIKSMIRIKYYTMKEFSEIHGYDVNRLRAVLKGKEQHKKTIRKLREDGYL